MCSTKSAAVTSLVINPCQFTFELRLVLRTGYGLHHTTMHRATSIGSTDWMPADMHFADLGTRQRSSQPFRSSGNAWSVWAVNRLQADPNPFRWRHPLWLIKISGGNVGEQIRSTSSFLFFNYREADAGNKWCTNPEHCCHGISMVQDSPQSQKSMPLVPLPWESTSHGVPNSITNMAYGLLRTSLATLLPGIEIGE